MAMVDRFGLPIAIHLESASPHEVTLVEATIASRFVADKPQRLIGDRACDSAHWTPDFGTKALNGLLLTEETG